MFAGDFNGDGNLDVLVWDVGLYEFFGNGDGTFQAGIPLFANLGGGLVMADFNHDGFPDIMTASDAYGYATDGIFSVFLGQPGGSFQFAGSYAPYPYFLDGPYINGLYVPQNPFPGIVGDFNGDGNPDVALFPYLGSFDVDPALQILYGNGDGTFTPAYVSYPLVKPYVPQFAADLNGNGLSDLVELDNYNASFNVINSTASGPAAQVNLLTTPLTGASGTGRVVLNVPAATPTSVSFVTSDSSVTVSGITIPAGSVSQDFTFSTGSGFNPLQVFSIEAQVGSATATAYDYFSTPPMPVLEMTPSKLVFEGVVAGGPNVTFPVTVRNVGAGTFTVSIRQATPSFSETDNCGSSLSQGASCTMQVTFTSVFPGDTSGSATLQDLVTGVFGSVALEGDSVSPLQISPCCLGFSEVAGGTSSPQVITLSNVGTIPIQINSVVPSGNGIAQTNNCSTIAVSGSCQINVTFNPTSEGSVVGTLTLNTNVPNTTPFIVPISGNAGDFSLGTAAPATVSPGGSATYNLSATSSGGFSGNVSLACSGVPSGFTCSVDPSSVHLSADGTSPYSVTVTTAASDSSFRLPSATNVRQNPMAPVALFGLVFVVFLLHGGQRPLGTKIVRATGLCVGLLLVSCGGGGGSGTQPTTYMLTITGTIGSVSHTTSITLNVE